MTGFVGAIDMGITRCITLVAIGYDVIADTFAHSLVEYKILPDEFVL